METNAEKTKVIRIGKGTVKMKIYINGKIVEQVKNIQISSDKHT